MKHPRMTLGIKFLEGRAQKVKLALSYSILRKNLEIDSIIIHPDYAPHSSSPPSYSQSDIALLKLKAPLDLDKYVPACLPEWNRTFVGMTAWIYGWGRFIGRRRGPLSNILRQTTGRVISEQNCRSAEHWPPLGPGQRPLGKEFLCTLGEPLQSGTLLGTCAGDSGGPVTVQQADGRQLLIGVISFTSPECGGVKHHLKFAALFIHLISFFSPRQMCILMCQCSEIG